MVELYSLDKIENTAQAITNYVCECMKEMKCGTYEIREYTKQAKRYDFQYLIQISQEYLDMLNNNRKAQNDIKITYL